MALWKRANTYFVDITAPDAGERLQAAVTERDACKTMVGLLVLAADGHEARLADEVSAAADPHGAGNVEQPHRW